MKVGGSRSGSLGCRGGPSTYDVVGEDVGEA